MKPADELRANENWHGTSLSGSGRRPEPDTSAPSAPLREKPFLAPSRLGKIAYPTIVPGDGTSISGVGGDTSGGGVVGWAGEPGIGGVSGWAGAG